MLENKFVKDEIEHIKSYQSMLVQGKKLHEELLKRKRALK